MRRRYRCGRPTECVGGAAFRRGRYSPTRAAEPSPMRSSTPISTACRRTASCWSTCISIAFATARCRRNRRGDRLGQWRDGRARCAPCARPPDRRPGDQACGRARAAIRGRYRRRSSRLSFRYRAALCAAGREGRLRRHRDVQHAAADAGAGRRRARGRQQSDRDRRAVRGPDPDRARHGDQRSGHGQDPHGGKGRTGDPATWAVKSDGSATTDAAEAIAGMLLPSGGPKGFGLAFLIDLLCGLLSGGATGARFNRSTAMLHSLRFLASVHRDRCRAFRRSAAMRAAAAAAERSAPASARRVSRSSSRPVSRNGVKRESAAGQVMLAPAVAEMLLRLAKEFGFPRCLAPAEK